ncbi:hypothetical protein PIB30_116573 [Stylosanthes scabra]|uniref:Reverse transcriptase Ty1/copia-type domain-containing protein n=1 Tax=Stylosanthes scabra TaxID=79078 RepID=A0ABU6WNJ1_9FABA|nr:hypothetical protein [Stylosanthes scabra]
MTATFLINRLPSPALQYQSPYERLFLKQPDYHSLRVFGCFAHASTLQSRRHKFSPRAVKSVFIGYPTGYRGYKLYDLEKKFFISRDVTFVETEFPFSKQSSTSSSVVDNFPDVVIPHVMPDVNPSPLPPPVPDSHSTPSASSSLLPSSNSLLAPQLRRSTRQTKPPQYLADYKCHLTNFGTSLTSTHSNHFSKPYLNFIANVQAIPEPAFYHQAVRYPEWRKAMDEELQAMEATKTWSLVPLPHGKHTIGCRWVYKVKCKADGSVERYKARLVAKGYTQQAGIDYKDTFSPVAKLTTVRVLLSLAAIKGWFLLQMDVNNAFLNGDLFEEVYMDLPLGYKTKDSGLVCRLNKSIYGLKQASRQWFCKFSSALLCNNFKQSKRDYSLFTYGTGAQIVYLLVYVDDIILASSSKDM